MKLELKHLAPYLPYNLKWRFVHKYDWSNKGNIDLMVGLNAEEASIQFKNNTGDFYINGEDNDGEYKPILYPLNYLCKEINHKGRIFIPLHELLAINQTDKEYEVTAKYDVIKVWEDSTTLFSKSIGYYYCIRFSYDTSVGIVVCDLIYDTVFNRFTLRQKTPIEKQMWLEYDILENKLLEWNFDKFNLISAGLAIDINTIKDAE